MNKKVTLNFVYRNWEKVKNSEEPHFLILRLLPHARQVKTSYQLPPKHWDKKAQQVKRRYWDEHPNLVAQINRYKDEFVKYYKLIEDGDIHPDAVCSAILHTSIDHDRKVPMLEVIDKNKRKFGEKTGTREKHRSHLRSVLNYLNKNTKKHYKDLYVDMLKSKEFIDDVLDALDAAPLKNNTINNYLGTLDQISRVALEPSKQNPFEEFKKKRSDSSPTYGIPSQKFFDGFANISNYKDIEAYLLWLYSFSLQGLDLVDIANIDESKIIDLDGNPIDFTHYHPFGDLIGSKGDKVLTQRLYLTGIRSKSAGLIDCCFNMFPVLFIRDWLHYIMQMTNPEIVYKGTDRLRLFNVTTLDSNGKEVKGALKKIKAKTTYVVAKMNKCFGGPLRHSRHTYTQIGKKYFGYTIGQMDYQLNHKVRSTSNTYQQGEDAVTIRDYRHFQLMNYFEITDILRLLKESVMIRYKRGALKYVGRDWAIPPIPIDGVLKGAKHKPPFMAYNNEMLIGQALLEFHQDSEWTSELQKEYDILIMQTKEKPLRELDEYGMSVSVYLTPDHPKYPKRLKELEKIRKRAFGDFPIMINVHGGIQLTEKAHAQRLEKRQREAEKEAEIMNEVNNIIKKG